MPIITCIVNIQIQILAEHALNLPSLIRRTLLKYTGTILLASSHEVDLGEGALADNLHNIPILEINFCVKLIANLFIRLLAALVLDEFEQAHTLGV